MVGESRFSSYNLKVWWINSLYAFTKGSVTTSKYSIANTAILCYSPTGSIKMLRLPLCCNFLFAHCGVSLLCECSNGSECWSAQNCETVNTERLTSPIFQKYEDLWLHFLLAFCRLCVNLHVWTNNCFLKRQATSFIPSQPPLSSSLRVYSWASLATYWLSRGRIKLIALE